MIARLMKVVWWLVGCLVTGLFIGPAVMMIYDSAVDKGVGMEIIPVTGKLFPTGADSTSGTTEVHGLYLIRGRVWKPVEISGGFGAEAGVPEGLWVSSKHADPGETTLFPIRGGERYSVRRMEFGREDSIVCFLDKRLVAGFIDDATYRGWAMGATRLEVEDRHELGRLYTRTEFDLIIDRVFRHTTSSILVLLAGLAGYWLGSRRPHERAAEFVRSLWADRAGARHGG